jgi:DeoR/GlpR family transcriptional regulator of sugar metabolism
MNQRQKEILKLLSAEGEVSVNRLSQELKVSAVTIRQDLQLLEREGLLSRFHGGAIIRNPDDITNRLGFQYDVKLKIAQKAASFVQRGETVLIESGSSNALLAKELAQRDNTTILTTNVFIARQLKGYRNVNVILLGGIFQHESESLVGKLARYCIDHVNFTKSFIGIDGFTEDSGFTSRDMMRAEIASYIIKKSTEVFILTDSSKFGTMGLTSICKPEAVDYVITDGDMPAAEKTFLKNMGVQVITI